MQNVTIFGARDETIKNDATVVARSLQAEGVSSRTVYWEDLVLHISNHEVTFFTQGEELPKTELALAFNWYKQGSFSIYREVAHTMGLYFKKHKIPIWNSEIHAQRSTTKLSTLAHLALEHIPVSETIFSLNGQKLYEKSLQLFSFPMIVKSVSGSRGDDNYLVRDKQHLGELLLKPFPNRFLVQPFMLNDHDLRIICFGGEAHLILERSRAHNDETHLNNTSQGGEAEWRELADFPQELLTICNKICTITKKELAGIDFIPDMTSPTGYACLEVNAIPQLTSGVGVAQKMKSLAHAIKQESKL